LFITFNPQEMILEQLLKLVAFLLELLELILTWELL